MSEPVWQPATIFGPTLATYDGVFLPPATGDFLTNGKGELAWYSDHCPCHRVATPSDRCGMICRTCGLYRSIGSLVMGVGKAAWLPPIWMDVGFAPLNMTAENATVFCGVAGGFITRPPKQDPGLASVPPEDLLANALQLARHILEPGADIPLFPSSRVTPARAVDCLGRLMVSFKKQIKAGGGWGARIVSPWAQDSDTIRRPLDRSEGPLMAALGGPFSPADLPPPQRTATASAKKRRKNPDAARVDAPAGWSKPLGVSDWAKKFGVCRKTMSMLLRTGKVRNDRYTSKLYRVALESLPPPSGSAKG